ncbi:MAG TPA: hypothetical protein VMY35_19645 [Phycisphaerae bacterium]|nr:hypothetical protein [Phycisphaerae bacterium]
MSGDGLKHVRAGDLVQPSALMHNLTVDAIRQTRQTEGGIPGSLTPEAPAGNITTALNDSGADVARGDVVSFTGEAVPGSGILQFEASAAEPYGIALAPIRDGKVGRVAVAGGPWLAAVTGSVSAGDSLTVSGASLVAGDGTFIAASDDSGGYCQVAFRGGAGAALFELRTSDPVDPPPGKAWIRTDLT